MAKPLNKKTSFSSIEQYLDHNITDSLLARIEESEIEPLPKPIEPIRVKEAIKKIELVAPVNTTKDEISSKRLINEPTGELANIKRDIVLTPSTAKTLDDLEKVLSSAIGSPLTRSHVARVLLKALKESIAEIAAEANKLGPMKRPSNAKGCEAERDKFEAELVKVIIRGIRG